MTSPPVCKTRPLLAALRRNITTNTKKLLQDRAQTCVAVIETAFWPRQTKVCKGGLHVGVLEFLRARLPMYGSTSRQGRGSFYQRNTIQIKLTQSRRDAKMAISPLLASATPREINSLAHGRNQTGRL